MATYTKSFRLNYKYKFIKNQPCTHVVNFYKGMGAWPAVRW